MKESQNELNDYSGEYKVDLKFEDFSKEYLIRILHAWSKSYLRMDETWYRITAERSGEAEAKKCRELFWSRIADANMPKLAKELGIEVKTVLDAMKAWQLIPDGVATGYYPCEAEVINPNHIIWTITRCISLEWFEKQNDAEQINWLCNQVEAPAFERYLKSLLPKAEIKPLIIPDGPRKDPKGTPPCRWELKMED
ncbi:MAG: hypothetical protein PHV74_14785 [Dehalococcoidia bacterium]|nr:hypothetical protein [Dehalococcoidia bacterium]